MDAVAFEETLAAFARARCGAERVEVRWAGMDPARLPDAHLSWEGDPCRPRPTLTLWVARGEDVDRVAVRPVLGIWVRARVAEARALPGERVLAVDGTVDSASLVGGAWTEPEAVAVRTLQPGDPLTRTNVRAPDDASAGDSVVLRVRVGALEVRSDGRLVGDAKIGEPVRAWVRATDTVVSGVLTSPDTVDVEGP